MLVLTFAMISGCVDDRPPALPGGTDTTGRSSPGDDFPTPPIADGGTADFDGGPSDGGPIDGGIFDAGPFDAGGLDAGPIDAGGFDGGLTLDAALDGGPPFPP